MATVDGWGVGLLLLFIYYLPLGVIAWRVSEANKKADRKYETELKRIYGKSTTN